MGLRNILCSTQREQFVSDKFVIGSITWQLIGYPFYDTASFHVYLRPIQINPTFDNIIVSTTLYCADTLCGDASIFRFVKDETFRAKSWTPGCLSMKEIRCRNLNQLSLSVNLQILRIQANKTLIHSHLSNIADSPSLYNQKFKWSLDNAILKEMKQSPYGKCFISFDNPMFCIKIFPNGYQRIGQVLFELQWLGITGKVNCNAFNKLLCWQIKIPQAQIEEKGETLFSFDSASVIILSNKLSFEQIKQFDHLTIYCHVYPKEKMSQKYNKKIKKMDVAQIAQNKTNMEVMCQNFIEMMSKMQKEIQEIKKTVNKNFEFHNKEILYLKEEVNN